MRRVGGGEGPAHPALLPSEARAHAQHTVEGIALVLYCGPALRQLARHEPGAWPFRVPRSAVVFSWREIHSRLPFDGTRSSFFSLIVTFFISLPRLEKFIKKKQKHKSAPSAEESPALRARGRKPGCRPSTRTVRSKRAMSDDSDATPREAVSLLHSF